MSASIPPNILFNPLQDKTSSASLKTLSSIISTCLGPHGKLKLLQNSSGGSSTITSSSQRLFKQLSVRSVFSKIVISSALSQLRSFNDNGLTCSILSLNLIQNSMVLDYSLPTLGALYGYLGHEYLELLKSKTNPCTFNVDFNNLTHLRCMVNTILSSKPGCVLTTADRNHLSNLILEAFLNVVSSRMLVDHNIRIVFSGGSSAKCSRSHKGLLVRVSENVEAINIPGPYKTVLFATSLVGEVPVNVLEGGCSEEEALENVESVVKEVIDGKVRVVFCQKVVHPRLKKQFRKAKVLVLDRLGSEATKYLQYISGGNSNSSLFSEVRYGAVSSIQELQLGRDRYLLVCNDEVAFYSLVIHNFSDESGQEMMVVCRQAVDALFGVLKSSQACFGGGCTEIHTANLLIKKVLKDLNAIQVETSCSSSQVHSALRGFVNSIVDTCMAIHQGSRLDFVTDTTYGHLWKLPSSGGTDRCACGLFSATDLQDCSWRFLSDMDGTVTATSVPSDCDSLVLVDELGCKMGCFALAVETASSLLRTTLFVNNAPCDK